MTQDILITPGSDEPQILFRGSGTTDTAIELNVLSSFQSATGSGTALTFEGTEGQLFGITDNLSSGTIFSVSDITGLPSIEVNSDGQVKLGEYASGIVAHKPITLESGVPSDTTYKLYNDGGTLYFDGSTVGGGGDGGVNFFPGSGLTMQGSGLHVYGGSGHFVGLQNDGITTLNSGIKTVINEEADAATITFDMDVANSHSSILGGNRTLAVSNVDAGQRFSINLSQDATGSRTVTWWSSINWLTSDGSEPTLKTAANSKDYFGFVCTSGGFYDGFHLTEDSSTVASTYSAGSGLTLVGGEFNVYGGSGQFIDLKLQSDGVDDLLTLISTDDGSDAAPVISTMRDSASPADGDYLGQIKFKGRSDTGTERVYAKITGKTLDVTNGTEDGLIEIAVMSNGSQEIVSRIRNDGWRIVNDNNLYIQDNGSLGVRVSPSYSLHVQDDAYIGSGLTLPDVTPASTDNKVYNEGTKLHFNGSGIPVSHPVTNASGVNNMMIINSGDYTALASKDPNTIYFLV